MGEATSIAWTDSYPQTLFSLELSLASDALRLKVYKFMTEMAQCHPVGNGVPEQRVTDKRENMMRTKVATPIIAAMLASVSITRKNLNTPNFVLRFAPIIEVTLTFPMLISVMIFPARRPFFRNFGNAPPRFCRMALSQAVAGP